MTRRKTAYSYIRFSTKKQELGDSKRRQLQNTVKFCAEEGLHLSNVQYNDEGLSG